MKYYGSPRWSGEICDCSMPMTLDTYSLCSYRCLYCFAFNWRSIGGGKGEYLQNRVRWVNPEKVMKIFTDPDSSQFGPYVKQRLAMQWGGLSDQFDEHERKHGITLELLKFFRAIQYPISFSTKATWWTEDERYVSLFRGADHFNLKFSIITLDEEKAGKVEALVPSPEERLKAMERAASWGIGGVTLRLRPFIIGVTTPSYLELIERAADAGAEAVSTEFLCVGVNAKKRAYRRFGAISRIAGYDIIKMYKSMKGGWYLRGNREMKRPYVDAMQEKCDKLGLRFYVSDAHFKERCANGSCCGLRPEWNYSRGQFTEALVIAKEKGQVRWADIEPGLRYADFSFGNAEGFNQVSSERRAAHHDWSMKDYVRREWNNVNGGHSPYKYFGGVLHPVGRDGAGDVIYEYWGDD